MFNIFRNITSLFKIIDIAIKNSFPRIKKDVTPPARKCAFYGMSLFAGMAIITDNNRCGLESDRSCEYISGMPQPNQIECPCLKDFRKEKEYDKIQICVTPYEFFPKNKPWQGMPFQYYWHYISFLLEKYTPEEARMQALKKITLLS